jgi:hypothetical protein
VACPEEPSSGELWIGTNKKQGVSVISSNSAQIRIAPDYDETLRYALPVEVLGERPFNLLAIWMMKEPVHYVPNLVAILEHYTPFIERCPTVVAGDFNANPNFDAEHRRYLFSSITDRFDQLSLSSAYHSHTGESLGQETQATHYYRYHQDQPFHIDYLFFPLDWHAALTTVTVGNFDDFASLSDHRPLSAQFSDSIYSQLKTESGS